MASAANGTIGSIDGTSLARNAGLALERLIAGPDRDKRLAQMFGISPRMVRYLRNGKRWTPERLAQAMALFGAEFARHLVPKALLSDQALECRLMEIERQLAEVRSLHYGMKGME
jgi:hypothetical protein